MIEYAVRIPLLGETVSLETLKRNLAMAQLEQGV